ncbi:MAG: recombination mediator RecR [Cellvibrionaceae bacterium]|nr:recombination mediator RecR [Cellvibrionaceae bacterium]
MFSPLIDDVIQALCCLPGVGRKSAQRMAFHLLERNPEGAHGLAQSISRALEQVGRCQQCRTLTEEVLCGICRNPKRSDKQLCVVETPADIIAVEQAGTYQGKYFVLMGHLSPIDGIGPEEIGLPLLQQRLQTDAVEELILATNSTVEGEATAHYIAEQARQLGVSVSRIAQGVPLGGELEYIDGGTLAHALNSRRAF